MAEPAQQVTTGLGAAYWRLWTAQGAANLADGVLKVALPLAAIGYTRSPALIAGVAFAVTVPWLLFALPAGALVDRLDRRRVMIGADAARAALLGVLAVVVVADAGSIWALYVIGVCVGVTETFHDSAAQSLLPQVVRRDQLERANGRLFAVELTANEFVGPPLAGFLVAAGLVAAFATPAGLWALAVGALLLVPGSFRVPRERRTTLRADVAEGVRFLWGNPLLRTFSVMVGVFNFTSNAAVAVLVLYAVGPESPMGLSPAAFGVLLATTAAGSLAGSFVAERIERALGRTRALAISFAAGTMFVATPALTAHPVAVGAGFFVSGVSQVVANVIIVSARQRITPDRLLGRLNSAFRLVAWGPMPLGAAAGGVVAEAFGVRAVFAVMSVVALTTLLGLRVVTDEALTAAERDAGAT
jgi:MFS family permease